MLYIMRFKGLARCKFPPTGIWIKLFDGFAIINSCLFSIMQSTSFIPLYVQKSMDNFLWTMFLFLFATSILGASVLLAWKRNSSSVQVFKRRRDTRWMFRKSVTICITALFLFMVMAFMLNFGISKKDRENFTSMHGGDMTGMEKYERLLKITSSGFIYGAQGSFLSTLINVLWFLKKYTDRLEELKDLKATVYRTLTESISKPMKSSEIKKALRYPLYQCARNFKALSREYSTVVFLFFFIYGGGILIPVFSFAMLKEFTHFGAVYLVFMTYSSFMLFAITLASEDASLVHQDICHLLGEIMGQGKLTTSSTKTLHKYKECFWRAKIRMDAGEVMKLGVQSWVEVITSAFSVAIVLYQVSSMEKVPVCPLDNTNVQR